MPSQTALSPKASIAAGAIYAYIRPRLAQDAKIDLKSILLPMRGGKSFHDSKAAIANAVRSVVSGRLAQDADIDDVAALLDAIENVVQAPEAAVPMGLGEENGELEVPEAAPAIDPTLDPDDEAKDDGPAELMAKVREFLKDHVSEEVLAQFDQLVGSGEEPEAIPPAAAVADPNDNPDDDDMSKDNAPMTKAAMDAAIAAAVHVSEKRSAETRRAIRAAEDAVRPIVGDLAIAYDSADEVYRAALTTLGVKDVEKIHASAYPEILSYHGREQRATSERRTQRMATDALPAGAKTFAERYPGTSKIVNM